MLLLQRPYQMFIGGQFEKQDVNLTNGVLHKLIMFVDLSDQSVFLCPRDDS